MKKTNNKGFTLVELIVVLVILAILAAILVPALLGYIDKAREKQITTNAEAAYVAAQALATEAYGKNTKGSKTLATTDITNAKIIALTDLKSGFTFSYKLVSSTGTGHNGYIIKSFLYTEGDKCAIWTRDSGVSISGKKSGVDFTETSTSGGWITGDAGSITLP